MSDRAKFEREAERVGYNVRKAGAGLYFYDDTEMAWELWQAARAQGAEPDPIVWINPVNIRRTMIASPGETVEVSAYREGEFTAPLYTHPPAQPGSVPEGWKLTRESADRILVEADGLGVYVARMNSERIADIMLYAMVNDLLFSTTATAPQAKGWVKCSDRLPTEADADCDGCLWVCWHDKGWRMEREYIRSIDCEYFAWMPTGLKRPQPPKQEGE